MKFSARSYLFTVLYFVGAACFFVMIRFVGLTSVPAFATLDHEAIDLAAFFTRAVIVGSVIGTIFFFFAQAVDTPAIRRRPYGVLIAIQAIANLLCVFVIMIGVSALHVVSEGKPFTRSEIAERVISYNFIVISIYYTFFSFLFLLLRQFDQKFGPGNLRKIIAGTFYHPREIEMIVMFLDLKESTTHAERLGHLKFARLIQDCFMDMSVVTEFKAQFYQYVGDESILLWEVAEGLDNANCLRAYFAFVHQLEKREEHYRSRYGLMPQFKAGVNIGFATVLEVGEIKREISYLGDVLNTAARIQGQCNIFQENLMLSEMLYERLPTTPADLLLSPVGMTELKGRAEPVHLYSVEQRSRSATRA